MGYLIRTLNYKKRIILSDLNCMMSIANHEAISVEIPKIDSVALSKKSSLN